MLSIKKKIKRVIYGKFADSDSFSDYLRKNGCSIGSGTVFFSPKHCLIDMTRPWLINIGENVMIPRDVTILTHGYDWSVIKGKYGDILGSSGKVTIGNNVFIGMKTTILKGVNIGDNVIIGANSLVNKDIPANEVWAGVPAKYIMSIDEYKIKRESLQLVEAVECCIEFFKRYKKWPKEKDMREFIFLFGSRENAAVDTVFNEIGRLVNNFDMTYDKYVKTTGKFKNYDDFIEYCKKQI